MYTIKRAAQLTGVPEASLRAWERRYGVVVPHRSDSGYRLYDDGAVAALITMRRLVDDGWSPAAAAGAVLDGSAPPPPAPGGDAPADDEPDHAARPAGDTYTDQFLRATARLDIAGIDESLDAAFGLGSFEHVVDSWLFPALTAVGQGWERGEIDIAGEHAASHAVHRRLSAAFDAAGSRARGPAVVVGLPSGSQHELGALAFATALRRSGMNVLYLGANVPPSSWELAVTGHAARAVVLVVVTPADRAAAVAVADALATHPLAPVVCAGGASATGLGERVRELAPRIGDAARQLDELTARD